MVSEILAYHPAQQETRTQQEHLSLTDSYGVWLSDATFSVSSAFSGARVCFRDWACCSGVPSRLAAHLWLLQCSGRPVNLVLPCHQMDRTQAQEANPPPFHKAPGGPWLLVPIPTQPPPSVPRTESIRPGFAEGPSRVQGHLSPAVPETNDKTAVVL